LLAVTLDDLKRVARDYLQGKQPVRAAVAPHAKQQALEDLGFHVLKV
jgi:hypothetical protein